MRITDRFAVLLALTLALATVATLKADPAYYAKKATWPETLAAAREALAKEEADSAKTMATVEVPTPMKGAESWGPWQHLGPFVSQKSALAEVFPPEKEIDLTKTYDGKRWTAHPEWVDGTVHDLQTPDNSATYLYRVVTVKKATTLTAYFGSDDGMAAWLNGKELIRHDVPRGTAPNQDSAKLQLKPGDNQVLFKIHNQTGGCGFYFSTQAQPKGAKAQDPKALAREQLWDFVARDFADTTLHRQMGWERQDGIWAQDWAPEQRAATFAQRYAGHTRGSLAAEAKDLSKKVKADADLEPLRQLYYRGRAIDDSLARFKSVNPAALQSLRLAIQDLSDTFGAKYPKGGEYLKQLDAIEKTLVELAKAPNPDNDRALALMKQYDALRQEALLANPLIDFDKLLLVRRSGKQLGLPQNWQGNCSLPRNADFDNDIAVLSPVSPQGQIKTLYKPEGGKFVGDVDLHFDASKMLFSMIGTNNRWQIFEIHSDGSGLRQLTPADWPDVDNYDPCYLPSGQIIFDSTGCFQGIPCVGGSDQVANLYRMDADGKNIRQLCFDQDHDWCPTVLNDGRVLYTRWEYSDTSHYFTRLVFRMNPDGTNQMEYSGSNSFWPNSTFYSRPIPNHPTKLVAVISGHHGVTRMGELVIFDPAKGRREADGVVQRIPGYGKPVEPLIRDGLVDGSWPKFLHPYPLSEKYFLVSCKPTSSANWGLYLVDIYDNMLLLAEQPGYALMEPVPFRKTVTPPAIPERVDLKKQDATVYLSDIYSGPGLAGIPRGSVKNLRLFEIHYAYQRMGGHMDIGVEGPWDVHRILGTVPVLEDGSAAFKVPANTPIAVQPLDSDGKALQLMRSWFTAMPGETLSCVGCHETQNSTPPLKRTLAMVQPPSAIQPWYGPARGFSFKRDVQPALDKYCVGCHSDKPEAGMPKTALDLSAKAKNGWSGFTPSYLALHPYVRRPGPESDYHILKPMEFHADTSELVQLLKKGHYGVQLDKEAWDRIVTWIDLNVPDHGTWNENHPVPNKCQDRRLEFRTRYANVTEDPEAIPDLPILKQPIAFVKPLLPAEPKPAQLDVPGWPFTAEQAKALQAAAGPAAKESLDLGNGVKLDLVLIPAGEYAMGSDTGALDERPRTRVKIDRPFWMAVTETTNRQYQLFDPAHDNRFIDQHHKDHTTPGYSIQSPNMPVVKLAWTDAVAYCQWLSAKTGKKFSLPSEAQWEWACRAGSAGPFSYGDLNTDFGKFANLGDVSLRRMAVDGVNPQPIANPDKWRDYLPKESRFDDGQMIMCDVAQYQPNAWGLHDMHGNAAEWTRSAYQPYPYAADGRDDARPEGLKVVRGGSWSDRPFRATASFRMPYRAYEPVDDVGFRVICEVEQVVKK